MDESPSGCRFCGIQKLHHGKRWSGAAGMHTWIPPFPGQIKARMRARQTARQTVEVAAHG